MTLLEVIVSLAILAMISLLIYGAFDSLNRGKKGEAMRVDRARQGREAMLRIVREMSSAYVSAHRPLSSSLITSTTAFQGTDGAPYDRIDFTAFVHRRMELDAKESDQAEVAYFVVKDPDVDDKFDLVRREQSPIDIDPKKGGVVNVLAENVELFDLKYLDPVTARWTESWNTTQAAGQPNRLPLEVRVSLTMKAVPGSPSRTFTTKFMLPMEQALTFGISQ